MSVSLMLESHGHIAERSKSGPEAIELLTSSEYEFDCIVLDYSMPKMNGLSVLKEIRALKIAAPVILCSGILFSDDESNKHEYWPEELLNKPFRLAQLAEAIARVCQ